MSFDAWLVSFGLARILAKLELCSLIWAYQVMTLTALLDAVLLVNFFSKRRKAKLAGKPIPRDSEFNSRPSIQIPPARLHKE
jgi:hypothetical protein